MTGSGCTPGPGALPDGRWFGYVAEAGPTSFELDLACWFAGEAAAIAAAQDGEESPPPNDYHIRNVNPALRTVAVIPGSSISWLEIPGDPASQLLVSYAFWITARDDRPHQPAVWVEVQNGTAMLMEEQYQP